MPAQIKFYDNVNILKGVPDNKFKYSVRPNIYGYEVGEIEVISYTESRMFSEYRFPKRILTVVLNPQMYYDILSKITPDKPFIPVTLNIDLVYTKSQGNQNIESKVPFIQASYMALCDKTKASKDVIRRINNDSSESGLDQVYILRLALFDIDDLNATRNGIVAGNIGNKNIQSLIEYGFKLCKISDNIKLAIAPPDNTAVIPKLILRALGFPDYIKFLDDEYGIYTSRYNLYIENNTCYILNTEKNDEKMASLYGGIVDDKIFINVYPNADMPEGFYSVELKDNHCYYNIFQNSLVEDEISLQNITVPVDYTINSDGKIVKSGISQNPLETLSPRVSVTAGRKRTITKSNKNPKFSGTVTIEDLPIYVQPYTQVRYISNNRIGNCMISRSIQIFTKGTCTTQLYLKSFEEFMDYTVEPKQTGKGLDKK